MVRTRPPASAQAGKDKSLGRNRDSLARTIITVDRGRPPDQPGGARVIARA